MSADPHQPYYSGAGLDPRVVLRDQDSADYEELYPAIPYELQTLDIVLLAVRVGIIAFFLICLLIVIVDVAKDKLRLKSWRLYLVVCLVLFCWLGLSIYQDHIDEYFVQQIYRFPQRRSIYWCFRNLVHGLTLYLIILLLSHLSDFQHRGWWLIIILAVVLVPLAYSVALLIIDLRLEPAKRFSWEWNVGIDTVRVFLYNVLTTIMLFIFSPRFCTRMLFGTYSENRSPIVVLISRWTFAFLLLHNMTAIASFGAAVTSRIPPPNWALISVETATIVHRALEEGLLLMVVFSVPLSYIIAMIGHCCYGGHDELDQEKVDKIYQEVWTAPSGRRVTTARDPNSSRRASQEEATQLAASQKQAPPPAGMNGAPRSRQGSTESLRAADLVLIQPSGRPASAASAQARPASAASAASAQLPYGGRQGPPSSSLSAQEAARRAAKRNRESYMEAISMGSLNESEGRYSRTSEPIDL